MNKNSNLPPETKVAIFKGKEIRKIIYNNEWWFSIADVVGVLTDSTDVRQYIKKMRQRDPQLESHWGTICTPLDSPANMRMSCVAMDARQYRIVCAG